MRKILLARTRCQLFTSAVSCTASFFILPIVDLKSKEGQRNHLQKPIGEKDSLSFNVVILFPKVKIPLDLLNRLARKSKEIPIRLVFIMHISVEQNNAINCSFLFVCYL